MDKINFQNLPNTTTPVHATNLNTLQNNVENAINGITLYSDSTGEAEITLSDNSTNYNILEIYYEDIDGNKNFTKIYEPNGKYFLCYGGFISSSVWYFKGEIKYISGTTITSISSQQCNMATGGITGPSQNTQMKITKVIGYN